MVIEISVEEIPAAVRTATENLLAGERVSKPKLLAAAEWWSRNAEEDNVITELAVFQLYLSMEPPTPHEQERLEDERDTAIFHLKDDLPELLPDNF